MKTFKPGIYGSLVIAVAVLYGVSGVTDMVWSDKSVKVVAPAVEAAPATVDAEVAPAVTSPIIPGVTPGIWTFAHSGPVDLACLYSDEQLKSNAEKNVRPDSRNGALCVAQQDGISHGLIEIPNGVNHDFERPGVIDVEFIMYDGSEYDASYFVHKLPRMKVFSEVELMNEYKSFVYMAQHSRSITVREQTMGGAIVQHFTNGVPFDPTKND